MNYKKVETFHETSLLYGLIKFVRLESDSHSAEEIDAHLREITCLISLCASVIIGVNPSIAFILGVKDVVDVEEKLQILQSLEMEGVGHEQVAVSIGLKTIGVVAGVVQILFADELGEE